MTTPAPAPKWRFLPPIGSPGYYVLLAAVAILVLGPLGGVTAAYMNFSLGFFVGGQVLAGILGSVVTFGYGPEGRHGANYMQTMAASVASMAAMGVLIQAMVWLGLPEPPTWQLIVYFLCIGMFGVGLGMLYTPILVDKMKLTFPSGLAVANILRALTDVRLLKQSVAQLGSGIGIGTGLSLLAEKVAAFSFVGAAHFSASTFGAGIIVGARIGVPAVVVALIGYTLTPWLRTQGLLGENDPWRKVGFLIALGTILGAAIVDITLILRDATRRLRGQSAPDAAGGVDDGRKTNVPRLVAWCVFWAVGIVICSTQFFGVPLQFALIAIALAVLFVLINGISLGISDSNPISSAFVVSVLIMAALGLKEPSIGILAAGVLLVSTTVGCDMQQDRSTGWRLGSNRTIQFRFQVIGITMGAFLAVVMTRLFMTAYPELKVDIFSHPELKVEGWQSAMTYKFVGALRGITSADTTPLKLLGIGLCIGLVTEVLRKAVLKSAAYQAWKDRSTGTKVADFVLDAVVIPSPYASSFGGFVDVATSLWFGGGGVLSSVVNWVQKQRAARNPAAHTDVPEDMSSTSLVGGGLIAGEAIAALTLGLLGMAAQFWG